MTVQFNFTNEQQQIPFPNTVADVYKSIQREGRDSITIEDVWLDGKTKDLILVVLIVGENRSMPTIIRFPFADALEIMQRDGYIEAYDSDGYGTVYIPTFNRPDGSGNHGIHIYDTFLEFYESTLYDKFENSMDGLIYYLVECLYRKKQ
jgi:hypothetical protein